jgi:hypothetical protein
MARFAFSGGFFCVMGLPAVLAEMKPHAAFSTDEFNLIYYHSVVIFDLY